MKWIGSAKIVHKDKYDNIIWVQDVALNSMFNDGEQLVLNLIFANLCTINHFNVRLVRNLPLVTNHLSDLIGEPTSNGYAPCRLNREISQSGWTSISLLNGYFQAVSAECEFFATGAGWGPVQYAILTSVSNDSVPVETALAFVKLSQSRTLVNGNTTTITYTVGLK